MNPLSSAEFSAVRLQKFLAEAGLGSRRGCEVLIQEGRVQVNGQVVRLLGSRVTPGRDKVEVEGRRIRVRRKLYIALHKPVGYVCSRRAQGRDPLVLDLLPPEWHELYPVGRLDRESEGLLLLSNDGEFCLRVTHPRFGVRKTYQAMVMGRVEPELPAALIRGVRHRGEQLQACEARVLSSNNTRSRVELVLTEGKNREVRRLFAALGLQVEHLIRTRIGPVQLGELRPGKWRTLQASEIATLRAGSTRDTAAGGRTRSTTTVGGTRQPEKATPV